MRFEEDRYDSLPLCSCGGAVMFCYNETPDRILKEFKAWFKCLECSKQFYIRSKTAFRIMEKKAE